MEDQGNGAPCQTGISDCPDEREYDLYSYLTTAVNSYQNLPGDESAHEKYGTESKKNKHKQNKTRGSGLNRKIVITLVVTVVILVVGVVTLAALFLTKGTKNEETTKKDNSIGPLPQTPVDCPNVTGACDTECHPGFCCDAGNDPTKCEQCAHAQASVTSEKFCVSSCDVIGSRVLKVMDGIDVCEETVYENLADPQLGTTCEADTEYSASYRCENVMKGDTSEWNPAGDGPGYAIRLNFDRTRTVFSLEIKGRPARFSQCSEYELEFSGNKREKIYWTCQEGHMIRQYFFSPRETSFMSVKCTVDCGQGGAQGFRRLSVYGTV